MSRARDIANIGDGVTAADITDATITAAKMADGAVEGAFTTQIGRRNLIINGAMQVAQRGASFTSDGYTLDRFYYQDLRQDELSITITQDSDAPAGFANSLKIVAGTAESSWTTDEFVRFFYKIEAQDIQHLNYGTSDAVTTTLSFWVKSDVTGTYCVSFYNPDSGRRLTNTYTVNAADTWEYKTVTVVGDTSGSINNDNGEGIQISFCLATGPSYTSTDSTSWVANSDGATFYGHNVAWGTTTNDYWQITGVQLEVGDTATPFEHRSYGEELALCQRYFQYLNSPFGDSVIGHGHENGSDTLRVIGTMMTEMRAQGSLVEDNNTQEYRLNSNAGNQNSSGATATIDNQGSSRLSFNISGFTGIGENTQGLIKIVSGGNYLALDAEL